MPIVEFAGETSGERLDRVVTAQLEDVSRSAVQRWIRSGQVTVNGQVARPSYKVAPGDFVSVVLPEKRAPSLEPRAIPLDVVYEDPDCVVVNKPPGLVVHPATSYRGDTLVHALLARYPEIADMADPGTEKGMRPGIVHRLDKDTSGLLVLARHEGARKALQEQFKARRVRKGYVALLYGRLSEPSGRIEAPIGRDPHNRQRMAVVAGGRKAVTEYETRHYLFTPHGSREQYTLVDIRLLTGRTHQIRVHFAHTGHPVVGDEVYGRRRRRRLACSRQFLHARWLGFYRPSDGKWVDFEASLPGDLEDVLSQLEAVR